MASLSNSASSQIPTPLLPCTPSHLWPGSPSNPGTPQSDLSPQPLQGTPLSPQSGTGLPRFPFDLSPISTSATPQNDLNYSQASPLLFSHSCRSLESGSPSSPHSGISPPPFPPQRTPLNSPRDFSSPHFPFGFSFPPLPPSAKTPASFMKQYSPWQAPAVNSPYCPPSRTAISNLIRAHRAPPVQASPLLFSPSGSEELESSRSQPASVRGGTGSLPGEGVSPQLLGLLSGSFRSQPAPTPGSISGGGFQGMTSVFPGDAHSISPQLLGLLSGGFNTQSAPLALQTPPLGKKALGLGSPEECPSPLSGMASPDIPAIFRSNQSRSDPFQLSDDASGFDSQGDISAAGSPFSPIGNRNLSPVPWELLHGAGPGFSPQNGSIRSPALPSPLGTPSSGLGAHYFQAQPSSASPPCEQNLQNVPTPLSGHEESLADYLLPPYFYSPFNSRKIPSMYSYVQAPAYMARVGYVPPKTPRPFLPLPQWVFDRVMAQHESCAGAPWILQTPPPGRKARALPPGEEGVSPISSRSPQSDLSAQYFQGQASSPSPQSGLGAQYLQAQPSSPSPQSGLGAQYLQAQPSSPSPQSGLGAQYLQAQPSSPSPQSGLGAEYFQAQPSSPSPQSGLGAEYFQAQPSSTSPQSDLSSPQFFPPQSTPVSSLSGNCMPGLSGDLSPISPLNGLSAQYFQAQPSSPSPQSGLGAQYFQAQPSSLSPQSGLGAQYFQSQPSSLRHQCDLNLQMAQTQPSTPENSLADHLLPPVFLSPFNSRKVPSIYSYVQAPAYMAKVGYVPPRPPRPFLPLPQWVFDQVIATDEYCAGAPWNLQPPPPGRKARALPPGEEGASPLSPRSPQSGLSAQYFQGQPSSPSPQCDLNGPQFFPLQSTPISPQSGLGSQYSQPQSPDPSSCLQAPGSQSDISPPLSSPQWPHSIPYYYPHTSPDLSPFAYLPINPRFTPTFPKGQTPGPLGVQKNRTPPLQLPGDLSPISTPVSPQSGLGSQYSQPQSSDPFSCLQAPGSQSDISPPLSSPQWPHSIPYYYPHTSPDLSPFAYLPINPRFTPTFPKGQTPGPLGVQNNRPPPLQLPGLSGDLSPISPQSGLGSQYSQPQSSDPSSCLQAPGSQSDLSPPLSSPQWPHSIPYYYPHTSPDLSPFAYLPINPRFTPTFPKGQTPSPLLCQKNRTPPLQLPRQGVMSPTQCFGARPMPTRGQFFSFPSPPPQAQAQVSKAPQKPADNCPDN
ncbi:proline-rich protein 36-like [Hemicordylus capensis]|uniref:proline-rich protein 36-like n=1 Tax=Hemicordylus capensis TaxID=884348 RepID=UPI00230417D4|nr:proline-rich protein 36-like [Hemicordylus capensis]